MGQKLAATALKRRGTWVLAQLIGLFLAVTLATGIANAQNASLSGTVMDETGAVIPAAAVTATGIDTGVEYKASANAAGNYYFASLPPGNYRVTAVTPGFAESVRNPVALNVAAQIRLNFTLSVSEVATTVEVAATAESPLLQSGAVVGSLLGRQQIADLPLVDRNAANLALTQAGVEGGIGEGVTVAGADTQALLVTVDGINVSNTRITRAGGLNSFQLSQSVDLVSEVRVTSSPADAEFGRSVGRVEMATRSGTNQFHGSLTNGFRNTALNANTYWNNLAGRPRQTLKRNQFAARVDGPIVRNRTFFFALYDGQRQRGAQTGVHTVLTPTARQGIYRFFTGAENRNYAASSGAVVDANGNPVQPAGAGPLQSINIFDIDPNRDRPDPTGLIQKYIDMTPLPNDFQYGDGLNTAGFSWQAPEYANKDQLTGKIDHNFNAQHMMSFTLTKELQKYTNSVAIYPTTILSDGTLAHGYNNVPSWFTSFNLTSSLSPTVVNQFKFGFQYPDMDQRSGTRTYPELYPRQGDQLYEVTLNSFSSPLPGNVDSRLVNPVYTVSNSTSWIRGDHTFKGGFQFDHMESNSWNINNRYTPRVSLGEGAVPLQGTGSVPGLVSQNEGTLEDMIVDFTGSVADVQQGFKTKDGTDLTWIPLQNERYWNQRSIGVYFKDDWKVSANVTLNLGLRWDWTGAPSEQFGRTTGPENGFAGFFGISGTGFDALWRPGASAGSLTREITIGGNSAHPDHKIYDNNWKGFGPAVGISWNIPYWGQDKTVLRAGYQISRPMAQSFLSINGAVGDIATTETFEPTVATFLNNVTVPLTPFAEPLAIQPINQKTNRLSGYDPNFQPPVVQNYNASIERQLTNSTTISVRYVGNKSTHQNSTVDYNEINVFENGIWEAANITAAGGDAPLFDQLFAGVNFGGSIGVVGVDSTGSEALRAYSQTRNYFAQNNAASFAGWLNTTLSLQPGSTAERGGLITSAGFPANFVVVNPQYNGARLVTSSFNRRYDSAIFELNRRTTSGWGYQVNFTWAKTYSLNGIGRNFRDWSQDRSVGGTLRSLKISGTYEFPLGPGKQFLNYTTGAGGVLAKVLGGWQIGGFLTMNSGDRLSFSCSGNPTSNSQWCLANGDWPENPGEILKTGDGGVYFLDPAKFQRIKDPFCSTITTEQGLQGRCNYYAMNYNGQLLLQHPAQGEGGNFNPVTGWLGPGLVNLDMNLLKRFQVTERIGTELRLDAISLPNNPHFGNPNTSINSSSFGRISEPSSGGNSNTSPASYYGNRVFVINARVSF